MALLSVLKVKNTIECLELFFTPASVKGLQSSVRTSTRNGSNFSKNVHLPNSLELAAKEVSEKQTGTKSRCEALQYAH